MLLANLFQQLIKLRLKTLKGFFEKIRLADETLEIFGIDPEYGLAYKENRQAVIIWSFTAIVIFVINLGISLYAIGFSYIAFSRTFVFEYPILLNSMAELNFILKIA